MMMMAHRGSPSLQRKSPQQQLRYKVCGRIGAFVVVTVTVVALATNLFFVLRFRNLAQQQQQEQEQIRNQNPPYSESSVGVLTLPNHKNINNNENVPVNHQNHQNVHVVFSTGCSIFQDWQSYALFYNIWSLGQAGMEVTRVVSGCSPRDEETLQRQFDTHIRDTMRTSTSRQRFHIHFTPDYSNSSSLKKYVYFNKSMGLRHWLRYGLKYMQNADKYKDTVFILVDPDELFLRPIPFDYTDLPDRWFQRRPGSSDEEEFILHRRVSPGRPMAARFLLRAAWMKKINVTELVTRYLNNHHVNNNSNNNNTQQPLLTSPLLKIWERGAAQLSQKEVVARYDVGPPYMLSGVDFYRLVETWASIVVAVHDMCHGNHISEMYAYSIAAIHLNLPHQVVHNWMLSNVDTDATQEAWGNIDHNLEWKDVCRPVSNFTAEEQRVLPLVLHYCQWYAVGDTYYFGKYTAPKALFSCEHPLYQIPTAEDLLKNEGDDDHWWMDTRGPKKKRKRHLNEDQLKTRAKRNAFLVCQILPFMNAAARHYKHHVCKNISHHQEEDNVHVNANLNTTYLWKKKKIEKKSVE